MARVLSEKHGDQKTNNKEQNTLTSQLHFKKKSFAEFEMLRLKYNFLLEVLSLTQKD